MFYLNLSDQELWEYCRQDDIGAYNELFDRHAKPLYRQAIRYVKNTMDAEELVMDLLFTVWQKRTSLHVDAGRNFKAYLAQAMRNRILNYFQKNIPQTGSIELLEEDALVESRGADYPMLTKDLEAVYQSKLDALSPQRRKVFKLSREENLSYAEIAQQLNLSVNTVENYMVAALAALRDNKESYPIISLLIFFYL